MKFIVICTLAIVTVGCATQPRTSSSSVPALSEPITVSPIPEAIRQAPPEDLQLTTVNDNVQAHIGKSVRWGGAIVALGNEEDGWTGIEVAEYPLNDEGQPKTNSSSRGHFLVHARIPFDPAIYAVGRGITVAGIIEGSASKEISKLPLVQARNYYMWGQSEAVAVEEVDKEPARYSEDRPYSDSYNPLRHYGYYPIYRYDPWYYHGYYYPYFHYRRGYYPNYHFGFSFGFGD